MIELRTMEERDWIDVSRIYQDGMACGCTKEGISSGCTERNKTDESFDKKIVTIDFLYLDLNTCDRCMATDDTLNESISVLTPLLQTLNYAVEINRVNITTKELAEQYRFISSPTIRVNGVDICNELRESDCKDCGDLCGDSVDCRVFVYNGEEYEEPPVVMIVDGILRALFGQPNSSENVYEVPENLKNYFKRRESIMKTMFIYEPALCCETGVCGVSVDPELLRISTVANNLKKQAVIIQRYNLNSNPQAFVDNAEINQLIMETGVEALPATIVDGKIVKTKAYPTNGEIVELLGIPGSYLGEEPKNEDGCCCKGGCC